MRRSWARGNNSNCVIFSVDMNHEQQGRILGSSDGSFPCFVIDACILHLHQAIEEHLGSDFESNTVLSKIARCFLDIPNERLIQIEKVKIHPF